MVTHVLQAQRNCVERLDRVIVDVGDDPRPGSFVGRHDFGESAVGLTTHFHPPR
jgi:hypothetical protein